MSVDRSNDARVLRARLLACIGGCLLAFDLLACNNASSQQAAATAIDRRVLVLMECEECNSAERDTVIQLGAQAIPSLRVALVRGPSERRRAIVDSSLRSFTKPPPSGAAIALLLRNYRSAYRRRAADALGAIGGPAARATLCEGRALNDLSPFERAVIDSALAHVGGSCL